MKHQVRARIPRETSTVISILFVCHGNICRSPMAEFVMKDLVERRGLSHEFHIASAATSNEEIGNDVHPGTKQVLSREGIPFEHRAARRLVSTDAQKWDLIIGMDEANVRNVKRMLGEGVSARTFKLLEFAGRMDDVDDPWYTGDFDTTFEDVMDGCIGLLEYCRRNLRA